MKSLRIFISTFLLSACLTIPTPTPTETTFTPYIITKEENLYAPKPEDDQLNRTEVILTSINLSERANFTPTRVEINFLGSMPSVCNELRAEIKAPDNQYRIFIEAYSVKDPKIKCENVFQQFEADILLGEYSSGKYSVWVNNEFIGDFISY